MSTEGKKNILQKVFNKIRSTASNAFGGDPDSTYKMSYLRNVKGMPEATIKKKDISGIDTSAKDYMDYLKKIKRDESSYKSRVNKAESYGKRNASSGGGSW